MAADLTGSLLGNNTGWSPWLVADNFLSQGFAVYVLDNVERGRSGFCAIEDVWEGQPIQRTLKEAWDIFRFGKPEDFVTACHLKALNFL